MPVYRDKYDDAEEEEHQFYRLFRVVIDAIMMSDRLSDGDIEKAIKDILRTFDFSSGGRFSDVDYSLSRNLCGYLYRYGMHGAGLVRDLMLRAAESLPELRNALRRRDLDVVSLGGGPGNDVVGLASAMQRLRAGRTASMDGCLNFTVVDAIRHWSRCVDLVAEFAPLGRYGGVSQLFRQNSVNMSSLCVQLPPRNPNSEYCRRLKNAKVIIISKLLSSMTYQQRKDFMQELHRHVSEGALVIVIDGSFRDENWVGFDVLHREGSSTSYGTGSPGHSRFNHNDLVSSGVELRVLRRRPVLSSDSDSISDCDSDSSSRSKRRKPSGSSSDSQPSGRGSPVPSSPSNDEWIGDALIATGVVIVGVGALAALSMSCPVAVGPIAKAAPFFLL